MKATSRKTNKVKRDKYLYWGFTGLMCIIFTFSALMYLFSYEVAEGYFVRLGFPAWMVYPSAIIKLLGVTAILSKKSTLLKGTAQSHYRSPSKTSEVFPASPYEISEV